MQELGPSQLLSMTSDPNNSDRPPADSALILFAGGRFPCFFLLIVLIVLHTSCL